jgi:hypothetical protein
MLGTWCPNTRPVGDLSTHVPLKKLGFFEEEKGQLRKWVTVKRFISMGTETLNSTS